MFADAPRAGLIRRLAAMMYDWLILAALWMAAMALALALVALLNAVGLISLASYTDHADFITRHKIWFQLYSVVWFCWFYLYFWCRGGQTLGMRAWRLLLVQQNGQAVTLRQAILRAITALFGIGNLWLWLRFGKGLALQDQLSNTQVVVLTKEQSKLINLHKTAR
ncbi:RDD family protein [Rheinheimera aquimaris]|uniref:RDD family protein n=1 Tax=Rheinheimera aquimaris TaxID=412437 RepID=A0ABP3PG13_9GAMM|nr:RDD family protein [Rheinheimera aquimaris]MCB5214936.1 RDD family protein [Rheinheimera aquimaris]